MKLLTISCSELDFFFSSGHILQVKEHLSKSSQDLIPSVFPNTWGDIIIIIWLFIKNVFVLLA